MWNRLKNKLIIRLMKNTRLYARTIYACVSKVEYNKLVAYMKAYQSDTHTKEEKFKVIFGGK